MKKRFILIALTMLLFITPAYPSAASALDDTFTAISTGIVHTMAVGTDGSLWAWGNNQLGQLGDGTYINRRIPVKVMDDVIVVTTGGGADDTIIFTDDGEDGEDYATRTSLPTGSYTMAVKTDGSLWAWGDNQSAQLGDGTILNRRIPVKIMDDVTFVSAGRNHTMAIKTDGTLWGWGNNLHGQIGDSTMMTRRSPVKIMDDVAFVSAGATHTAAIKTDGSLWVWGDNTYGNIGDGSVIKRTYPVRVMEDVVNVSTDAEKTMAVKSDGSLWAWGRNLHGQLGDGTTTSHRSPRRIMDGAAQVSTSATHTMAIKTDGSLWAWGVNTYGQIGDGTFITRRTPVEVMDGVAFVSAGPTHTTAIKTDGSLWVWGDNMSGQLTNIDPTAHRFPVMIMAGPPSHSEPPNPSPVTAAPTHMSVMINGVTIEFEAYLINNSNYFKLRDLAYALNETEKRFQVSFDETSNVITLTSSRPYTPVGGEMARGDGFSKSATPTTSRIVVGGREVYFDAYNISGSNFFRLRDIMGELGISVNYDEATRTVEITA